MTSEQDLEEAWEVAQECLQKHARAMGSVRTARGKEEPQEASMAGVGRVGPQVKAER